MAGLWGRKLKWVFVWSCLYAMQTTRWLPQMFPFSCRYSMEWFQPHIFRLLVMPCCWGFDSCFLYAGPWILSVGPLTPSDVFEHQLTHIVEPSSFKLQASRPWRLDRFSSRFVGPLMFRCQFCKAPDGMLPRRAQVAPTNWTCADGSDFRSYWHIYFTDQKYLIHAHRRSQRSLHRPLPTM